MSVYSIILCGGPGSRLWPESTPASPKPFIDLIGEPSLFQRTVLRMARVSSGRPPVIVTGRDYVDAVRRQLRDIGHEGFIIAEPEGRDSGPALLAAAAWLARRDPNSLAVAVASDHHIPDDAAFAAAVEAALPAAERGEIITFGVQPQFPATSYGYIRCAEALDDGSAVRRVARFVEKPDTARAEALLADGCLWNSGNFAFRAEALLAEAQAHAPDLLAAVEAALAGAVQRDDVCELGAAFADAPRVSIDVAVMEKTRRAAVLPIDYEWTDLGSWDSVWAASDRDSADNAVSGAAIVHGSEGCLVRAGPGMRVVALGLNQVAVVARDGDVLVSDLASAAALKPALAALTSIIGCAAPMSAAAGPAEALAHAAQRLKAWFWNDALPLWWCFGADHERGGFRETLSQDLAPMDADRRARVQARQVYVYATAGATGWPGPWRRAMDHGLGYLDQRYRRSDGLYRSVVDANGAPVDEAALLYDQAFVLLALAAAASADGARAAALSGQAEGLVSAIRRAFAHAEGGFRAGEGEGAFLANPLMHLFEAAQAWEDLAGGAPNGDGWSAELARELAELFLTHLFDPEQGRIREVFDARWRPAPGEDARRLEPGHHFEWAWLLERWGTRRGREDARKAARQLYRSGGRGVDPATGLVYDELFDDFSVRKATSRLWPQTERLRASLLLAAADGDAADAYLADALEAVGALEAYLDTPIAGLWRDVAGGDGPAAGEPAMASSFYHIVGAIAALAEHRLGRVALLSAKQAETLD
jgi:mannose-1-phosphate guanylyltransferase/mannose-6-phosphate isomerase